MEQSAVQHRLKHAPQTLQPQRVGGCKFNLDPTVGGLLSSQRQCRLSHVKAENRQSQRGDEERVLAGPADRIEDCSTESALGCQTRYCWLRPVNVPRRRAVTIGRIPSLSIHPFVTGWAPAFQRIVIV